MIRRSLILTSTALLLLTPVAQAAETPMIGGGSADAVVRTHGTAPLAAASAAADVELRLRLISRTGRFKEGRAVAVDTATGKSFEFGDFDRTGNATIKVPGGARYDVNAIDISADPANTKQPETVTLMSSAGVRVAAATTVTLDATKGKPVTAAVDGVSTERHFAEIGLVSSNRKGDVGGTVLATGLPERQLFAVPSGRVTDHTYAFYFRASLGAPRSAAPTHHLAFLERGGIPASLGFRVKQQDLAVVHADYRALGKPAAVAQRGDFAEFGLEGADEFIMKPFNQTLPMKATDYYMPGVQWVHGQLATTQTTEAGQFTWSFRKYQAGRTYRTEWNPAPLGPAFNPFNGGVSSDGKELFASIAVFSGGNPDQFTDRYGDDGGFTGTLTLSRDGKEIGRSKAPDFGTFKLPSGTGTYTLRSEATRDVPWTHLGSKVDTSWTFRDAADVFVVRTSGTDGRLKLTPQSQTGTPKLASVKVDYSVDDGRSWRSAPVNGDTARIDNPASGRFVSLRVSATDGEGNAVSQTVLKAYQV